MKQCILALAFLTLFFPQNLVAAETKLIITADMQFRYADSLYTTRDHGAAQVEFKRFVHFFPTDPRILEANFKTAMALYHAGLFHDAAKAFDQIIRREKESLYTLESYFMQSQAFMKMGNTGYAQIVLQNFLKLTDDPDTRDKIYHQLARIQIQASKNLGTDSLDQAEKYLSMISPVNAEKLGTDQQIKSIQKTKNAPKKNPVLSGLFAIIPGGGFLYCERYHDAFVTFCLNAGLMYAAYESFDRGNNALGGVITFVETGFYTGNIYGSVTAAHKYNKAQQIKILNREFNIAVKVDPINNAYLFTLNHPF